MKSLFLSLAAGALLATTAPAATQARARPVASPAPVTAADTIVVRLPNKAVMTLTVRDAAQLRELPKYHLDSLVARLGGYIRQAERAAETSTSPRVTVDFYPAKDQPGQGLPEQVRVTTGRKTSGTGARTTHVDAALDRAFGLKMTLDESGHKSYSSKGNAARRDSLREARQTNQNYNDSYLVVDFGLNALVNKGAGTPALRPEGSRYFNIGLNYRPRLGGKNSPLYLKVGPEFAFNNYMLEDNSKWVSTNGQTSVVPETNGRQYQKSKLATSTFTVPLMLQLRLRDQSHHSTFRLGAGGFVGYRLASWTKLKYFENGDTFKNRNYGAYGLTDWQYGLQATVGYGSFNLFVKYNLNEVFKSGQGPQAQTLSFGLRLLGN